jgi:GntR family transcriptional repressor for pyruvate dehydrogenase complex
VSHPPELAAQLGLSRNLAREAVKALAVARVLEVRRGDGTYVTSLQPRLLLEGLGIAVELLQSDSACEDVEQLNAHDAAFHRAVVSATGNETLLTLLESISGRTLRARIWHGLVETRPQAGPSRNTRRSSMPSPPVTPASARPPH